MGARPGSTQKRRPQCLFPHLNGLPVTDEALRRFLRPAFLAAAILVIAIDAPVCAEPARLSTSEDGVQRGTIIVDSYSYDPNELEVRSGVPVELTLESVTLLVPHTFVIREEAAGLQIRQKIPAGGSAVVRFTPGAPGDFTFFCDKKLLFMKSHREKGMAGTIHVR